MVKTKDESKISIITFVSLLDAYSNSQLNASKELKSCIWNIHKARRAAGSFHLGGSLAFTASDIREDIDALALLSVSNETNTSDSTNLIPEDVHNDYFKLHLDGLQQSIPETEEEGISSACDKSSSENNVGLRQRKGIITEKPKTSMVKVNEIVNQQHDMGGESKDPIEIFGGITPRDLKTAQSNAKAALISYIEAANLVMEMNKILGSAATKKNDQ